MYKNLHMFALAFLMSGCGAAPRKVEIIEEEEIIQEPAKTVKAGSNHIELQKNSQLNDLVASGKLVIIDFFATWCVPCKTFSPDFERVSAEFPDIMFVKVDVDKFDTVAKEYGVQSMPTIQAYKNGKQVDGFTGIKSAAAFRKFVKNLSA